MTPISKECDPSLSQKQRPMIEVRDPNGDGERTAAIDQRMHLTAWAFHGMAHLATDEETRHDIYLRQTHRLLKYYDRGYRLAL